HPLIEEPMVLLHSRLAGRAARAQPLLSIEPTSATWPAIHPLLSASHPRLLSGAAVFVESFGAGLPMARAGFGNGLLPLGLAVEAGLPRASYRELHGVSRRVALLTRKTVYQLAGFSALREALTLAAARHFARHRRRA